MPLEDGAEVEILEPVTDEVVDTSADPVVVAPVEPVAKVEPKTMEDSIRERFRELNKPPVDENAGKAGFVKDPVTGRFVKGTAKPNTAAKPSDAPADPNSTPADEPAPAAVAKEEPGAKPADLAVPPTSWGAAARAEYPALSPALKAQVHKREADFHKGLAEYKGHADVGKEIMGDFTPYLPMLRAAGTTPKQLVQAWTNLEYKMYSAQTPEAKAQVMLQAAKAYGVEAKHFGVAPTPAAVDATGNPVAPPVIDPVVKQLQDQVQSLTKHLETEKTAQARIDYSKIEDEIKGFAQTAGHEHFEAVRHDMSALMETGRAKDLQDAYNKAIWANDEVRPILIEKQRVDEANKAAEKAAAAKKAASANVAPRGTPPVKTPKAGSGTMDDTLRSAYRAIQARSAA